MKKLFSILKQEGITPNQIYLLNCKNEGSTPVNINVHDTWKSLQGTKWINEIQEVSGCGLQLLKTLNNLFIVPTKVDKKAEMIDNPDFIKNCITYREIFPHIQLPTKKSARSDIKSIKEGMAWFMINYPEYTWETIFTATENYIKEKSAVSWMYCRSSKYFIRKMNSDRTWISDLAEYSMMHVEGILVEPNFFKENVK